MLAHIIESEYDAPWHAVLPVAAGAANALWAVVFECPCVPPAPRTRHGDPASPPIPDRQ